MMRQANIHSNRFSERSVFYIIFISLTIAFFPVLLADYVRQDDLKWQLWPGMSMLQHYDYKTAVFELVRPISYLFTFTTDMISYQMQNAVFIRLVSILCAMVASFLIYRWDHRYSENQLASLAYAIASFTLPAFQVYVATANYFFMMFTVVISIASLFLLRKAFFTPSRIDAIAGYGLAGFLFFAALLSYPLSAMSVWILLLITFLHLPKADNSKQKTELRFFLLASAIFLSLMLLYWILVQTVHWYFHVITPYNRSSVIDPRNLERAVKMLIWHANLWWWKSSEDVRPIALSLIGALFLLGLVLEFKTRQTKKTVFSIPVQIFVTLFLFILSLIPLVLAFEFNINLRYGAVTMPFLLYLIFWSINQIEKALHAKWVSFLFPFIAIFGVITSNTALENFIVGPQEQELNFLRENLEQYVKPYLLRRRPVTVQVIWTTSENGNNEYGVPINEYNAPNFEYGLRIRQYPDACIGAVVRILREMGFDYNYVDSEIIRSTWDVGGTTAWGILDAMHSKFFTGKTSQIPPEHPYPAVVIDMRKIEPYSRFSLYKNFLGKILSR